MMTVCSSKMLVAMYQTTEDHNVNLHHNENLKSHIVLITVHEKSMNIKILHIK